MVVERVLIETMVDQIRSRQQVETKFIKETWIIFIDQVKEVAKCRNLMIFKKIKNKLDTLKKK